MDKPEIEHFTGWSMITAWLGVVAFGIACFWLIGYVIAMLISH